MTWLLIHRTWVNTDNISYINDKWTKEGGRSFEIVFNNGQRIGFSLVQCPDAKVLHEWLLQYTTLKEK